MTYNADDPKQVAKATKQAEIDEALKFDALRGFMGTAAGRKYIHDYMIWCKIFSTTFMHGSPDGSAWQEGMRNAALRLMVDCENASPSLYATMIQEAKGTVA